MHEFFAFCAHRNRTPQVPGLSPLGESVRGRDHHCVAVASVRGARSVPSTYSRNGRVSGGSAVGSRTGSRRLVSQLHDRQFIELGLGALADMGCSTSQYLWHERRLQAPDNGACLLGGWPRRTVAAGRRDGRAPARMDIPQGKRDASRGVSALGVAELVEELLLLRVMQPQNGVHAIQQTLELNALSVGGPARRQVSLKRAKLTGL